MKMIIDRNILCVNAAYAQPVVTKTEVERFLLSALNASEIRPEGPQFAPTPNEKQRNRR